jgi:formyltetrahydrofolate deformylase
MAVLVSKSDHCLYDLLIRHQSGELPAAIPMIISNHADLEHVAKQFGIPFRHLPMEGGDKEARARAGCGVWVWVRGRRMQDTC